MRIQARLHVVHLRFVECVTPQMQIEIEICRCFALSCDFSGQVWLVLQGRIKKISKEGSAYGKWA